MTNIKSPKFFRFAISFSLEKVNRSFRANNFAKLFDPWPKPHFKLKKCEGVKKRTPPPPQQSPFSLEAPSKKSYGREKYICSATTFLGGGATFPWWKCVKILMIWETIMSGRETLSLNIEALQEIHMPQIIRRGSSLIFLYMLSCNHVLHVSSMDGRN